MSLIGDIQNLITEHGSASILREKVGLLETQRGMATTERDKLSGQLLDARQKITVLGEQITRLTNERDEARQQLQRRLKQPEVDRLPPESEKMLLTLANAEEGASSEMLIQQLGLPKAKGDYFFDQLRKRHLVQATYSDDVALFFRATEAGREYLAKANLL